MRHPHATLSAVTHHDVRPHRPACSHACSPHSPPQVRYEHPLLGTGWLSASGTIAAADDATLLLRFDRFWWDIGEDTLRPELAARDGSSGGGGGGGGGGSWADGLVGALGRAAFLPQLARFPVESLDAAAGLAVFRFPPLASSIAIVRRGGDSAGGGSGSSSGGSPQR